MLDVLFTSIRTPRPIAAAVAWSSKHGRRVFIVVGSIVLACVLVGLFCRGTVVEAIAGQIQAAFTCMYIAFVAPIILFGNYRPQVARVLEWWPIALVRMAILVTVAFFTCHMVYYTATELIREAMHLAR